jgi:hypothetical protein
MRSPLFGNRFLPFFVVVLVPLGCQKQGSFAPVKGRVLMDNSPLAKATVRFQPTHRENATLSPDCYGETDEQGYFTLKPAIDRGEAEGAIPGEYSVQISIIDRVTPGKRSRELVPAKYNSKSQLTYTVPPEGTTDAVFRLTSE